MRWFTYGAKASEQPKGEVPIHARPMPRPQPRLHSRAAVAEALERRQFLSASAGAAGAVDGMRDAAVVVDVSNVRPFIAASNPTTTTAFDVPSSAQLTASAKQGGMSTGILETKAYLKTSTFADASNSASRALSETSTHSYAGRPPKTEPKPLLDRAPDGDPATRPPTVLLVEDDAAGRNALTVLLKRRGFNVVAVATVAEGIAELANDPDRVIVDLVLPDGEGEAILRQVRAAHLHSRVTVMTGVDDNARLDRVRDLGAEAVLHKPISLTELFHGLSTDKPN